MERTLLTSNSNEINRGVVAASVIVINVEFCQRRRQPPPKICIARLLHVFFTLFEYIIVSWIYKLWFRMEWHSRFIYCFLFLFSLIVCIALKNSILNFHNCVSFSSNATEAHRMQMEYRGLEYSIDTCCVRLNARLQSCRVGIMSAPHDSCNY